MVVYFLLAVRLLMVRSTMAQCSGTQLEQFPPKMIDENRISVRNDGIREAMQLDHLISEHFNDLDNNEPSS